MKSTIKKCDECDRFVLKKVNCFYRCGSFDCIGCFNKKISFNDQFICKNCKIIKRSSSMGNQTNMVIEMYKIINKKKSNDRSEIIQTDTK